MSRNSAHQPALGIHRPLAVLISLLLLHSPAGARSWTSTDGRKIEADLVSATGTEVVLKLDGTGKEYTVALDRLSPEDNAFVEKWRKEMAGAPAPPKPAGAPGGETPFENWDAAWPDLISGEVSLDIEIAEENESEKRFVYLSPNYEFVCDVALTKNVVNRFSVLFEATHRYVSELPLSMAKARGKHERHRILLFESQDTYAKNGGPPGSAGVYMSGKDIIMVPLTSLGVEKGAGGYRVDYDKTNKTLPHEIVHQLTDPPYFQEGSRGWFSEGLAEYVAVTPYRSGKFTVRSNQNAIKDYVTAFSKVDNRGRNLGESISLPGLREFFLMSYADFLKEGGRNYGVSLLMAFYFFHWDGAGDAANVKEFLKALKAGKQGEEALESLLAGRSYESLESELAKAWRTRGVTLSFNSAE